MKEKKNEGATSEETTLHSSPFCICAGLVGVVSRKKENDEDYMVEMETACVIRQGCVLHSRQSARRREPASLPCLPPALCHSLKLLRSMKYFRETFWQEQTGLSRT